MQLTPEQRDTLGKKQVANIAAKLAAGKTITAREQAILDAATTGDDPTGAAWALGYDALAEELGVTTTTLKNWRNRPDLNPHLPKPKDNGHRHNVTAWRALMVQFGLKRADEAIHPDDAAGGDDRRSTRDWKNEREKLLCVRLQRDIDRDDGKLLDAGELELPLGAAFLAFQNRYSQFPERAAGRVTGFDDSYEVEHRMREIVDADLRDLNAAKYLDQSMREIMDELPFDDETDRLFSLVTFAGQDREALLDLIALVAREALRRIGVAAIRRSVSPGEAPSPDEVPVEPDVSTARSAKVEAPAKKPRPNSRKSTKRRKA